MSRRFPGRTARPRLAPPWPAPAWPATVPTATAPIPNGRLWRARMPPISNSQLHLFHDGRRTGKPGDAGASMMPAMATALTDQNIEDVAAYYSQQTPAGLEADPSYWKAGQKLYRSGDRRARDSGLRGLPWPVRPRQSRGRLSGAARPALGVRRQAAQCLQRRRALREERARRQLSAATTPPSCARSRRA